MSKVYKFIHLSAYLTIVHGFIYGLYKYAFQLETEYGVRPHPQQEFWQASHIILSPIFIFGLGLLWKDHIIKMFKHSAAKRKSGIGLSIFALVMCISGYLVQTIYQYKSELGLIHSVLAGTFTILYLIHHLLTRKA